MSRRRLQTTFRGEVGPLLFLIHGIDRLVGHGLKRHSRRCSHAPHFPDTFGYLQARQLPILLCHKHKRASAHTYTCMHDSYSQPIHGGLENKTNILINEPLCTSHASGRQPVLQRLHSSEASTLRTSIRRMSDWFGKHSE